jgi:hypothetical protein
MIRVYLVFMLWESQGKVGNTLLLVKMKGSWEETTQNTTTVGNTPGGETTVGKHVGTLWKVALGKVWGNSVGKALGKSGGNRGESPSFGGENGWLIKYNGQNWFFTQRKKVEQFGQGL